MGVFSRHPVRNNQSKIFNPFIDYHYRGGPCLLIIHRLGRKYGTVKRFRVGGLWTCPGTCGTREVFVVNQE